MIVRKKEQNGKRIRALTLFFETSLIIIVLNASSYFGTTFYRNAIPSVGLALTTLLLLWIWGNGRFRFRYCMKDLGLTTGSVSRRQWEALLAIAALLYFAAFIMESAAPSEVRGEVTLNRLFLVALFTLTFGPIFEETLFRGYLFKRSRDALDPIIGPDIYVASIFSGIAFGLWHLPSPIALLYFNDPIIELYVELLPSVLVASVAGIVLGELRRRTGSILPGVFLHFCSNSIYVITMALKLF